MGIASQDMIEEWILAQLTVGSRGFETTVTFDRDRGMHLVSFKDRLQ
jgi:hypothetical protein